MTCHILEKIMNQQQAGWGRGDGQILQQGLSTNMGVGGSEMGGGRGGAQELSKWV